MLHASYLDDLANEGGDLGEEVRLSLGLNPNPNT